MNTPIRQALISVSDKSGLVEFARGLARFDVRILSTGGTAKLLAENGVPVTEVSDYTGFPEMLDGRVKTLHPKIHGGLLARRDVPAHLAAIKQAGIEPIDLVVVNLYPFARTVAGPGCTLEEAIENIDIGGPAMLRSAAKNHGGVAVVVDPADPSRVPGLSAMCIATYHRTGLLRHVVTWNWLLESIRLRDELNELDFRVRSQRR